MGLEQATSEPVARHKAGRFAGRSVVDLCCGIGGDAVALGSASRVVAVDVDAGMCRRVRWNAEVYGVAERVAAVQARAERFPLPREALVHIDPDRRSRTARPARGLADYVPSLGFLRALLQRVDGVNAGLIRPNPSFV